jgi:RHS repeat-associated protein
LLYYPFGSSMVSFSNTEFSFAYGFNGMEKDDEVKGDGNSFGTEFRLYDPRLGKWKSIDPLIHDLRILGLSGYHYGFNNPIKYSDDEGNIPWDKVVKYTRVSSQQGNRIHPIHKTEKYHGGLDLATKTGSDVRSMAGGKVVKIGWDPKGYGNYVVIQHPNGYYSLYAHLESTGVKKGKEVKDGEVIGKSGNTGGSTGPHLHLEVIKADNLTDIFKNENKLDPQALGDLEDLVNPNGKPPVFINFKEQFGLNTIQSDNTRLYLNIHIPSSQNNLNTTNSTVNYTITATSLNIREGAGKDFNTIGNSLPNGSTVIATGNKEGDWAEVKTNDGRKGWIHTNYAKEQKN